MFIFHPGLAKQSEKCRRGLYTGRILMMLGQVCLLGTQTNNVQCTYIKQSSVHKYIQQCFFLYSIQGGGGGAKTDLLDRLGEDIPRVDIVYISLSKLRFLL